MVFEGTKAPFDLCIYFHCNSRHSHSCCAKVSSFLRARKTQKQNNVASMKARSVFQNATSIVSVAGFTIFHLSSPFLLVVCCDGSILGELEAMLA